MSFQKGIVKIKKIKNMSNSCCPTCKGKKRIIDPDPKYIGKWLFYFNQRGERVPHIDCPNCTKPLNIK